ACVSPFFFLARPRRRLPPSFPTRRSSDLGAEAVHPYLALETLLHLAAQGYFGAEIDGRKAIKNFVKAMGKGLKKVMSKMGITFLDRKSTRLNSSHRTISYAVFCLKKKKNL